MKPTEYQISSEKFIFASQEGKLHDKELDTKPMSYFQDAFSRFKRNKASLVASVIIGILILFAIFGPILSPYQVKYNDSYFRYTLPKNELFSKLGIDFWDGCSDKEGMTEETFLYYYSMGIETGHNAIKNEEYEKYVWLNPSTNKEENRYNFRLDSYYMKGMVFENLSLDTYNALQAYQNETKIQVIYPITELKKRPAAVQDTTNANYWYETKKKDGKTVAVLKDGEFTDIYRKYTNGFDKYDSIRVEGETPVYDYARKMDGDYFEVRVNYYEYYIFINSAFYRDFYESADSAVKNNLKTPNYYAKDDVTPSFLFGTTSYGQDIFTCLSSGARFSFILAIIVASVNLFVGAIYGAIEGYYGGKLDLIMERFSDILSAVPSMIIITLLKYYMTDNHFSIFGITIPSQVVILFIAFFATGWIGMASRTRMQFYRFKNQEYVMASRTLGAKDLRIMFKHIFPNALGTLVTSCVLIIPSMIFSETSLSYLGIIDLNTGSMTSVGTLLASGRNGMTEYPHMILFPSIYISLLMLSFNLFGNGLRDAFNPSLRGAEE